MVSGEGHAGGGRGEYSTGGRHVPMCSRPSAAELAEGRECEG